ncbi:MAG: DNA gyrase inhibitor YacG [Bdellovibrionales bacterium]
MTVSCPQCGKETLYDPKNEFRPFCSERCRLIDLGDWAQEKFKVPLEHETPSTDQDSDDPNPE